MIRCRNLVLLASILMLPASLTLRAEAPRSIDNGLEITLFAGHPQIVTPTSATVDAKGRLIVIENHTHFRPKDYQGPATDRLQIFEDTDGDGRADKITTYHEGDRDGMGLATAADGAIWLATRRSILRLNDTNGDGRADDVKKIVELKTAGNYPHNGLEGLAFDADGRLIFGFGENLGENYTIETVAGEKLTGGGEGGSCYRMRPDGTGLERLATGFWNPFGICVDEQGHIFATENDPDSRPPCRLLHVVPGSDFGYQFRYGRPGTHPLQCWNGELPGTMPMIAGTGEAPCEILYADTKILGGRYHGALLIAGWGDHALELYRLKPAGTTYTADRINLIEGGEDFRPVGLAVAPDGSLFISDWVNRSYPLHGQGRIWKVSVKAGAPAPPFAPTGPVACEKLPPLDTPAQIALALKSTDPAVQTAAVHRLALAPQNTWADPAIAQANEPRIQLGLLLAQQRSGRVEFQKNLPGWLKHADPDVRLAAARWTADDKLTDLKPDLEKALQRNDLTPTLGLGLLAALAYLNSEKFDGKNLDQFLAPVITDENRSPALRAAALAACPPATPRVPLELIAKLTAHSDETLRRAAVWRLNSETHPARLQTLAAVAADKNQPSPVRADAVNGLAPAAEEHRALLLDLSEDADAAVAEEALGMLNGIALKTGERERLEKLLDTRRHLTESVQRVLGQRQPVLLNPEDTGAWLEHLKPYTGRPDHGRRLFFNTRLLICSTCHTLDNRGRHVGPDLTYFGAGRTEAQVLEAILQPSREVAPQFYLWTLKMKDGRALSGFLHVKRNVIEEYVDPAGNFFQVKENEIAERQSNPVSFMPPGLMIQLTSQEISDLLAYLRRKR